MFWSIQQPLYSINMHSAYMWPDYHKACRDTRCLLSRHNNSGRPALSRNGQRNLKKKKDLNLLMNIVFGRHMWTTLQTLTSYLSTWDLGSTQEILFVAVFHLLKKQDPPHSLCIPVCCQLMHHVCKGFVLYPGVFCVALTSLWQLEGMCVCCACLWRDMSLPYSCTHTHMHTQKGTLTNTDFAWLVRYVPTVLSKLGPSSISNQSSYTWTTWLACGLTVWGWFFFFVVVRNEYC